ncbi:phosphotransferase [Cereibacter johrii]|uniref:phosphotransferase n=1 Tax=Cereibacter johrii TaxID=445629 RepID=UPI002B20345E|nr:phosphotransferase [Cereibacter johrii]MEA5163505.1 phosphotransferase [Cereibacter johrii]
MFALTHPSFAEFTEELGLLGLELTTADDPGAAAFAVLKAASVERWLLVPLQSRTVAAAALRMLTPMSPRSRLAKSAVLALNSLGLRRPWARNRIYLRVAAPRRCIHNWSMAAFFSGTPGPERKITVQLRSADSSRNAYLKMACAPLANQLITNEVRALQAAKDLELKTAILPTILGFTKFGSRRSCICSDETRSGFKAVRMLGGVHFDFLEEMAAKATVPVSRQYVDSLRQRHEAVAQTLAPTLDRLAVGVLDELSRIVDRGTVHGAMSHGDFTPWNCVVAGLRLYVFDWELSGLHPLGYDHLHFLVSTGASDAEVLSRLMQDRWYGGSADGARFLLLSYFLAKMFSSASGAGDMLLKLMAETGKTTRW